MSKIHVIPQGEHRDAEENKPKETPMDCKGQHANGGKGAEGMGADGPKNLFHILKIIALKIHVGRNQKFTSKNSRSKNSRAGLGVFPLGRARGRALFRGSVPLLLLTGAK